jgi:hypothetical protein
MMLFARVSSSNIEVHQRKLTFICNMTYYILILLLVGEFKQLTHVELRHKQLMHFVVYCQGMFFKADIQIIAITIESLYVQSLKREFLVSLFKQMVIYIY